MVNSKYLIVGNAKISGFDWNAALSALLNAGASYASAVASANAQQKAFEAAQAQAAANAASGVTTGSSFTQYLPYIGIGAVLLILLMRKK